MKSKMEDSKQIEEFVNSIFSKEEYEEGMYFDEFCKFN